MSKLGLVRATQGSLSGSVENTAHLSREETCDECHMVGYHSCM